MTAYRGMKTIKQAAEENVPDIHDWAILSPSDSCARVTRLKKFFL